MEKRHRHHVTPVHKGGSDDPDNIVELDFIEHARVHAERFLNGEDNWFDFRHPGWPYLPLELKEAVSDRVGEINRSKSGENHPSWGKHIHSEEFKRKRSREMTGTGNPRYGVTLSDEVKGKIGASHRGKRLSSQHKENSRRGHLKPVIIFDPEGNVYFHDSVKSAAMFHGLSPGTLSNVLNSKRPHTKGYKGRFVFNG